MLFLFLLPAMPALHHKAVDGIEAVEAAVVVVLETDAMKKKQDDCRLVKVVVVEEPVVHLPSFDDHRMLREMQNELDDKRDDLYKVSLHLRDYH
jgi:hypothetical protein